jgi:hypothetical protein
MEELKLELYQGPIDPVFNSLPGYTQIKEDIYWAVLMAQPATGSAMANWIKAENPGAVYPEGTNGTDTLAAGITGFIVSQVCVKHLKIPSYKYHPQVPNGPILGPIPIGYGEGGYYCVTPPPNTDGIGIWIVEIEKNRPGHPEQPELPVAPQGGRAVFPPNNLHLVSQPLLIVRGEVKEEKRCPTLGDISSDKSCYVPGESGVFTVVIDDPDSALCGYTWEFENTGSNQVRIESTTTNSVSITFDGIWDLGTWEVKVSAILCNAPLECGFSLASDIYEFGLIDTDCPIIDYLNANQDVRDPCKYSFEVGISGDYSGTRLKWNFGDGSSPDEQAVTSPIMRTEHTYSAVPANSVLVSVELLDINVCCLPQLKERWIMLPEEGCRGGKPEEPGKPGKPEESGNGGLSLCGFLLGMWIAGFVAAGILGYLDYWWPWGAIAYAVYGVFLASWIGVCCWPCARKIWKCCALLQWHFIVTVWLLQVFAILALASVTNPYVAAAYTLFGISLLNAILAIGKCRVPNPWNPADYPGVKCPGNWW